MGFGLFSIPQVHGMVAADWWVWCGREWFMTLFIGRGFEKFVTLLQHMPFKKTSHVGIFCLSFPFSFSLLVHLFPPRSFSRRTTSNINWENLTRTCLSWGRHPQGRWAASSNCGEVGVLTLHPSVTPATGTTHWSVHSQHIFWEPSLCHNHHTRFWEHKLSQKENCCYPHLGEVASITSSY